MSKRRFGEGEEKKSYRKKAGDDEIDLSDLLTEIEKLNKNRTKPKAKTIESLPSDVLGLMSSFLPRTEELKESSKAMQTKSIYLEDKRRFERELPAILSEKYMDVLIDFFKANQYLDLIPKLIKNFMVHKFIRNTNYNNWFTTNKRGLYNVLKTSGWLNMETFKLLLEPNNKDNTIEACSNSFVNLIEDGKFDIFDYHILSEPRIEFKFGEEEITFFDTIKDNRLLWEAIPPDDLIGTCVRNTVDKYIGLPYEEKDECKEIVVDSELLNEAYQKLFFHTLILDDFTLFKLIIKYEFKARKLSFVSLLYFSMEQKKLEFLFQFFYQPWFDAKTEYAAATLFRPEARYIFDKILNSLTEESKTRMLEDIFYYAFKIHSISVQDSILYLLKSREDFNLDEFLIHLLKIMDKTTNVADKEIMRTYFLNAIAAFLGRRDPLALLEHEIENRRLSPSPYYYNFIRNAK